MLTMSTFWVPPRIQQNNMTFRVYVRWPGQRVSDKTTTDSRSVAELAFRELVDQGDHLAGRGALGISFTDNGKQVDYRRFADEDGNLKDAGNHRS